MADMSQPDEFPTLDLSDAEWQAFRQAITSDERDEFVAILNRAMQRDVNPGDISERLSYRQRQYLAMMVDAYDYLHDRP